MKTSRVFNSKPTICMPVKITLHFQIKWLFNILKCFLHQSVTQSCLTLFNPHGLQTTRLLCPWDFPGKNNGMGCHFLLQEEEHIKRIMEWAVLPPPGGRTYQNPSLKSLNMFAVKTYVYCILFIVSITAITIYKNFLSDLQSKYLFFN